MLNMKARNIQALRIDKLALFFLLFISLGTAQGDEPPMFAIIIDDIGYHHSTDAQAVELPIALTCAFLPNTPYASQLARKAYEQGKEVMLHLPMEAMHGQNLGPGGLTLDMSEAQFKSSLDSSIQSLPHVRGINNHMGSLLTQHPGHMAWLMHELKLNPSMYFIDSRTTTQTVALKLAREYGIPSLKRDVFIDSIPNDESYAIQQLEIARNVAIEKGYVIAIGHPFEATLNAIRHIASKYNNDDLRFVTISQLINELDTRQPQWHAYLSPSLKAAKN
jgi:polysaccharide deacetylase 2 family uncharacterized protein YibQ